MFLKFDNITKILVITLLSVGLSAQTFAGVAWDKVVANFANELVNTEVQERRVFVRPVADLSKDQVYLPFSDRIGSSVVSSLISSGIQITNNPADAELYLDIGFYQTPEGLSLHGSVLNQDGMEIINNSATLISIVLPKNWNSRSLRDISYEIAGKFDEQLAGQRVNTVISGLTGGKSNSDEFISDFTVAMNQYMVEDLNNLPSIVVKDKSDINQHKTYVIPIEVKSGVQGKLKSLHQFIDRCEHPYAVRLYSGEFSIKEAKTPKGTPYYLMNLPYYLTTQIHQYLEYFTNQYKI